MSWPERINPHNTPSRPANIADEFQGFLTEHATRLRARKAAEAQARQEAADKRAAAIDATMSRLLATLDESDDE